jgi:serine/threonine protein kinase
MRCQFKLDTDLSPALTDLVVRMLKPDPNERATIPEIFSHPWVRGTAGTSGCLPTAFACASLQDNIDDDDDDDGSFAITYTPAPPASTMGKPNDEDKLPSIVQRHSRTDITTGGGSSQGVSTTSSTNGSAPAVSSPSASSGTPTGGRVRGGRIMDNPLQPKGALKTEKQSPRGSGTGSTGTMNVPMAMPVALSPNHPVSFKRYASSTGNTRARPRQPVASGGSGGVSANSNGSDKAHAERAPAHAGDSERLPVAHHKHSRRRSDNFDDVADSPTAHHGTKAAHAGLGSQPLETLGRKQHHTHAEPSSASD